MSFSYGFAPDASNRDYVRFHLGDTDSSDFFLHDSEIDGLLAEQGNKRKAVAAGARVIAAVLSREADKKVGDLSISASQRSKAYLELANRLERELSKSVSPFAGGISKSDKQSAEDRDDRVEPVFSIGQFDNPDAGTGRKRSTST